MDKKPCNNNNNQELEVRKGPWTMEEDLILINYIANHGEGVWNSLARSAGLKRTGKSCRLRWLNYLRPDVRRGNITPEEHLLIMELHAKWGNRWSKIAKHLPGRTDNEIKNFWRTRIQKHLKKGSDQSQINIAAAGTCNNHNSFDQLMMSCTNQAAAMAAATAAVSMSNSSNCGLGVESYSPSASSFTGNNMEAAGALMQSPAGFPTDAADDALWTVEDLWSMHLLNGD